ncbi:MAG: hypothetical protein IJV34_06845 [Prevotella sp.]|nr:hypothetical protein [Prevotella sp.]
MNREEYEAKDDLWQKFHRRQDDPFEGKDRFYSLRQFLNVTFIILGIIGMIVWFSYSHDLATYILIGAVGFKFIELTMRIMKL